MPRPETIILLSGPVRYGPHTHRAHGEHRADKGTTTTTTVYQVGKGFCRSTTTSARTGGREKGA